MARFVWYLTKRILSYIVMIFVATSLTFFLASAFMSPRSNYEQRTPRPPQDSIEQSLYKANLNDKTPVIERYQQWLVGVVTHFDWGMAPDLSNHFVHLYRCRAWRIYRTATIPVARSFL